MNKLMLALTFALALAYGTAAQGQGLERVAARCDLPTGWSEVTKLEPRFVVFGTRLDMLPKSYERYLVNGIRAKLGFDAVPVRVVLKSAKNPYASS